MESPETPKSHDPSIFSRASLSYMALATPDGVFWFWYDRQSMLNRICDENIIETTTWNFRDEIITYKFSERPL